MRIGGRGKAAAGAAGANAMLTTVNNFSDLGQVSPAFLEPEFGRWSTPTTPMLAAPGPQ